MLNMPPVPFGALADKNGYALPVWTNWFQAVYKNTLTSPGIYNVLNFGAKGNGVTDDVAAFNAAMAAAENGNSGVVYVPNTTNGYVISAPIELPSNVLLLGDNKKGLGLSRIKPLGSYTGNLVQSQGWNATPASADKIQQSGMAGIFLDGSGTTLTGLDIYGQECYFGDNTFKNMFTYGMRIAGLSSASADLGLNNNIQNNYFSKVGSNRFYGAVYEDYYTADNKIINNYIEGCDNAGIESRGANCLMTENHIYDCKYHILSRDTVERQVTDNYLEFCTHSSVRVENGSSSENQLFMIVSGNIFRNINTDSATDSEE